MLFCDEWSRANSDIEFSYFTAHRKGWPAGEDRTLFSSCFRPNSFIRRAYQLLYINPCSRLRAHLFTSFFLGVVWGYYPNRRGNNDGACLRPLCRRTNRTEGGLLVPTVWGFEVLVSGVFMSSWGCSYFFAVLSRLLLQTVCTVLFLRVFLLLWPGVLCYYILRTYDNRMWELRVPPFSCECAVECASLALLHCSRLQSCSCLLPRWRGPSLLLVLLDVIANDILGIHRIWAATTTPPTRAPGTISAHKPASSECNAIQR